MDNVIIQFIEENILTRFDFRRKIITDNAHEFKSKKMIIFCEKNNSILNHSTTYIHGEVVWLNRQTKF